MDGMLSLFRIPDMSNKKLGTLKKKPRKKKEAGPLLELPLEGMDAYPSTEGFTSFPTSSVPSIPLPGHALSDPAESLVSLAEGGVPTFSD